MIRARKLFATALLVMVFLVSMISVPLYAAPPSITGVVIGPDPAYIDTPLAATPQGWSDPDLDPEGYQWQWQIWDGVSSFVDIPGATTATLNTIPFTVGDVYNVVCTPFDGTETGTPVEASITISGGIVTITPDPAYTNSSLLATPEHWPAEVTSHTYQWQYYDGDSYVNYIEPDETSNTLEGRFVRDDQIQVVCTPWVADIAGAPVTAAITISNAIPAVDGVSVSPDLPDTASTLTAVPGLWSDADGDAEGYLWQWQIRDGLAFVDIAGATTDILDSSNFILNDELKVICTPFDGLDSGTPVEATTTISVLNYDTGVDIKPGSDENPINLKSRGVIPVVVYSTDGFDATAIDIATVKFGPGEASPVHGGHYEDVDDDGDIDLVLHFNTQATGISEGDTEVTLTGETTTGISFVGTDSIKIVPFKPFEAVQGNESAPGQIKNPGERAVGKAIGKENAPGQNKETLESEEVTTEENSSGKDSAPGQNKEKGKPAKGKGKEKDE